MWNVFTVLLTMPEATATAERSFSVLHRVKIYLRKTMESMDYRIKPCIKSRVQQISGLD